jgi:hypothetical protein
MAVTWCGYTTGAEKHEFVYCVPAQVCSDRVCVSFYEQRIDKQRDQNEVILHICLTL